MIPHEEIAHRMTEWLKEEPTIKCPLCPNKVAYIDTIEVNLDGEGMQRICLGCYERSLNL